MDARRTSAAVLLVAATAAFMASAAGPAGGVDSAPARHRPVVAAPAPSFVAGHLLVKFRPGVSAALRSRVARGLGAKITGAVPDLHLDVLRVPRGAERRVAAGLLQSGRVTFAEREEALIPAATIPNDPYYRTGAGAIDGGQWEFPQIAAPAAWDVTTGASTAVIAIVDSGVAAHPDLVGNLLPGHNVLDNSTNTNDTYGHGTEVAGAAVAGTNNSQGIAGTCWNCRLLPVKVYSGSSAATSDVAAGITWAADHGAQVINVSLYGTARSATLDNAVSYATSHGALVIAAAGNSGCNCVSYPAASPGALGVAASDQTDTLYSYSNYGSWVGIDAPAGQTTTFLKDPTTGAQWGYMPVGGTSLAAPVVAGVAGLVESVSPGLPPDALRNLLVRNVDPVVGSHLVASGRVNAYKALLAAGAAPPASSPAPSPSPTDSPAPTSSAPAPTSSAPAPTSSAASPSPTATPPTSVTTTFSGTLTSKAPVKTFTLVMGAGATQGSLSFGKCTTMTLGLDTNGGAHVASAAGPSAVAVSATVTAGSYLWTASGSGRCTFALTVTHAP